VRWNYIVHINCLNCKFTGLHEYLGTYAYYSITLYSRVLRVGDPIEEQQPYASTLVLVIKIDDDIPVLVVFHDSLSSMHLRAYLYMMCGQITTETER